MTRTRSEMAMAKNTLKALLADQDLEFIRVLEDLIELLIKNKTITLEMFPEKAIDKILQRR